MFEEIEVTVTGKVQGVMYRDFVQIAALRLGVCGSVENLADGAVRVVAQGTPDALKAFINQLHEGSVLAQVADVSVAWRPSSNFFDDFIVVHR